MLLVVALFLFIWFYPKKIQNIISLEEEPSILYVNKECRYKSLDANLDVALKDEFENLWCMQIHENQFRLTSGDFLLLYQNFGVIITSDGGYIYSLQDKKRESYQILNREKIRQIRNDLSEKQAVMY
jgi:hypothetical protein